jgi:hypothetical protein
MQIRIDATKNVRKFRSRSSPSASRPSASRKPPPVPPFIGGVRGSVKLKIPSASEATAAMMNV